MGKILKRACQVFDFLFSFDAGVWATQLAAMARLEIPLIPMKHAYVMSEPINGVRGCPNIRDHDLSTYYGIHGESLAMGGYEYTPEILDQVCIIIIFSC